MSTLAGPDVVASRSADSGLEVDLDPSECGSPRPATGLPRPPRAPDPTCGRSRRRSPRHSRSARLQRGLDMTVAYSKERVQFGRPIGSFQALKHRMADMLVLVEASRSASWGATAPLRRTSTDPTDRRGALRREPRWPGPTAPTRSTTSPARRSSCTAASRSPGSTTPSWSSSARTRSPAQRPGARAPCRRPRCASQRVGLGDLVLAGPAAAPLVLDHDAADQDLARPTRRTAHGARAHPRGRAPARARSAHSTWACSSSRGDSAKNRSGSARHGRWTSATPLGSPSGSRRVGAPIWPSEVGRGIGRIP